jgi:hypothetical protein
VATISSLEANLLAPSSDLETVRALALSKRVHSLALAQSIAEQQQVVLPIDVAGLNAALAQDGRKGLDDWLLKNWQDDLDDYYELRFLKQLTDVKELDWSLLRLAVQTCLLGEKAAASDWQSPGWSRPTVERADQLRFYAEQLIFDRIGSDWGQVVRHTLEQSAALYDSAVSISNDVHEAEILRDIVFDDAPYYMQLFHSIHGGTVADRLRYDVLDGLLAKLSELTNLLDRPHTAKFSEVVRTREATRLKDSWCARRCSEIAIEPNCY